MTLTPVNISTVTPVFMIYVYRGWSSNTQPPECDANALTTAATAAVYEFYKNGTNFINEKWLK